MSTRQEIAEALSTVDGVTGHVDQPQTPYPGDAWPYIAVIERDEVSGQFGPTYRVQVFTAQNPRAADLWLEDNYQALVDALRPISTVNTFTPVMVGSDQFGIEISLGA